MAFHTVVEEHGANPFLKEFQACCRRIRGGGEGAQGGQVKAGQKMGARTFHSGITRQIARALLEQEIDKLLTSFF
jgi:hypothetical protein